MELFQELVFTISISLIVSLLIAKLFSIASTCDDGNSTVSIRVEEKIEKEWVVCDSENEEKDGDFEDDVVFGYEEAELGSGVVIDNSESVGGFGACHVFDESPERTELKDDGNVVESDLGSHTRSLIEEDCVKCIEVEQELGGGVVIGDRESVGGIGVCHVFDESPERIEFKHDGVSLVKIDEGNVVESVLGSLVVEDCVKSIEVQQELFAINVGEVKVEEGDEVFDDDWQGIETTELEKSFGAAVAFMGSKSSADHVDLIDNEVKIDLYGLHRVVIEGSCFEPQPMAIKVSARANWNAWKRLENLGREDAMEQYIDLLSRHIPDWMGSHASEKQ